VAVFDGLFWGDVSSGPAGDGAGEVGDFGVEQRGDKFGVDVEAVGEGGLFPSLGCVVPVAADRGVGPESDPVERRWTGTY